MKVLFSATLHGLIHWLKTQSDVFDYGSDTFKMLELVNESVCPTPRENYLEGGGGDW